MPPHRNPAPADDRPTKPLTPSERRFVEEYLIDLNGTRAYRTVFPGTPYASARMAASRLVAKDNVAAEVRAAKLARSRRTQVRADAALLELAHIAFSDVLDLVDPDTLRFRHPREIPLEARRALVTTKVSRQRVTRTVTRHGKTRTTTTVHECVIEYRFASKLGALGKLFEHLGLSNAIPPLEVLLALLPPAMAAQVRAAIADGFKGRSESRA